MALVDEMSNGMLSAGMAYLATKGYFVREHVVIDNLKEDFLAEAKQANFLQFVGHSFDASHTELGVEKASKLTLVRTISGKTLTLILYLPPVRGAKGKTVLLSNEEKTQILCEGMCSKDQPFVVVSNSCNSTDAITSWMFSYYDARKQNNKMTSVPVVLAADRAFDTDSPYTIISHLDYPLMIMDGLASGDSLEEVKARISVPARKSVVRRALEFLREQEDGYIQEEPHPDVIDQEQEGFSPVCNIDKEEFFNGEFEIYKLKLTKPGDPSFLREF